MKQLFLKREAGIFILLAVLCTVVAILNPHFLKPQNLQNEGRLIGMFGIFSIGAGIVIITGGIDLSTGSLMALLGVQLAIILVEKHWPWPVAILTVLITAGLLGLAQGVLITRLKLQPFIVTLCGLLIYRGTAQTIAHDETKGLGVNTGFELLQKLTTGEVCGVPNQFILLVIIAIIMWVVLHRSVYGRYLFAIGQNEAATRYSGIGTRGIIVSAYVLSGLFGAISGILFAFYSVSISPASHAQFYELYGIAAAVLGGCSLAGGEGSIIGIVLGTALLQVLQNLVILLNIPSSLNFAVMGGVILIGVIADQLLKKK
ncbi:MAG TPA: ABC transporter permease [Chthoniobacteraceae bacterium]|jgi:ribose transport system permease protein|nr:ABC transporter permease [Chthoniobacteraceae bacterium]